MAALQMPGSPTHDSRGAGIRCGSLEGSMQCARLLLTTNELQPLELHSLWLEDAGLP
jgi:hypothetical protein